MLVELLHLHDEHPSKAPYLSGAQLHAHTATEAPLDITRHQYMRAIGLQRHLVDFTRPDPYIVKFLSRHQKFHTLWRWKALKHVASYVTSTQTHVILFRQGPPNLRAQSDADFAACPNTRQSTLSRVIYLGNNPIFWTYRMIKTVVTSTQAAEYNAARHAAHDIH